MEVRECHGPFVFFLNLFLSVSGLTLSFQCHGSLSGINSEKFISSYIIILTS